MNSEDNCDNELEQMIGYEVYLNLTLQLRGSRVWGNSQEENSTGLNINITLNFYGKLASKLP